MQLATVLAIVTFLLGCNSPMSNTDKSSADAVIHTEVGNLSSLISLPAEPVSVRWQIEENPARSTGTLRALVQFAEADAARIIDSSPTFDRRDDDVLKAEDHAWLTESSLLGIEVKEEGGRYRLVGAEPRKPDLFTKTERSPYVSGKVTPLANGFIFVNLRAS